MIPIALLALGALAFFGGSSSSDPADAEAARKRAEAEKKKADEKKKIQAEIAKAEAEKKKAEAEKKKADPTKPSNDPDAQAAAEAATEAFEREQRARAAEAQRAKEAEAAAAAERKKQADLLAQREADAKKKADAEKNKDHGKVPEKTTDQPVLTLQKLLNIHSAGLTEDGKFGPRTQTAWELEAKRLKQAPLFQKQGPTTARVDQAAYDAIVADAKHVASLTEIREVLPLQKALNILGAKLVTDGKFGPLTTAAWQAEAKKRDKPGLFTKSDATHARAVRDTVAAIAAAAKQAQDAQAAKPAVQSKPAPAPVQSKQAPSPSGVTTAKPKVPAGYDPAKARAGAKALANHLKRIGTPNYDHKLLKQWQTWAGLTVDGFYGGRTRGALLHYGVTPANAPTPFIAPKETVAYTPPA